MRDMAVVEGVNMGYWPYALPLQTTRSLLSRVLLDVPSSISANLAAVSRLFCGLPWSDDIQVLVGTFDRE